MKYLLLADVNKIKEYLFASVRLRQIVNASALLSDVNEQQTRAILKCQGIPEEDIICTTGGITQAVIRSQEGETDEQLQCRAERCRRELAALYPRETVTATAAVHVEEWDDEGENKEDFVTALRRGMGQVRQRKGGSDPDATAPPEYEPAPAPGGSPYFRVCAQTGQEYATVWEKVPEGGKAEFGPGSWKQHEGPRKGAKAKLTEYACTGACPCGKEVDFNRERGDRLEVDVLLRYRLARELSAEPERFVYPFDFERLARPAMPSNYLGFMDADGNGMGDCLTALADAGASKEDYAAFSHLLSEATREALIEAATAVLLPVVGAQKNHIPLRVLMLGGDDVLVMALPQYILPLANEFCRRFQDIAARRKEELPSERKAVKDLLPLTMSAGVVIAHQKFPFLSFKRLGERLLKSAKRRAWQVKRKWLAWKEQGEQGQEPHRLTGSVDFQVITASGVDDLKTLREEAYTLRGPGEPKEIRLTGRPYLVAPPPDGEDPEKTDELLKLRRAVARLRDPHQGASRGQMKGLHDVLRRGCQQGHMDFLRWFDRLRVSGRGTEQDARNQKAAICAVLGLPEDTLWPSPWQEDGSPKRPGGDNGKWFTPLLDVVELFDLPDDLAGDVKRKT